MTIIYVYIFDKKYNPIVLLYLTKDSVIYIGNIILIIYYVVCYLCHIYWQDNVLVYISELMIDCHIQFNRLAVTNFSHA